MLRTGLCLPTALLAAAMTTAAAQDLPRLQTNEAYVNEATTRTQKLAIDDPMAVFAYVLDSLPDRVKVYPTENHYYFAFDLNGIRYAGNIKIDAALRAQGKVEFSYYEDRASLAAGQRSDRIGARRLARRHGRESRAARLPLQLSQQERRLCAQRFVAGQAAAGGAGAGRSIHRSDLRRVRACGFSCCSTARLKLFHYILDETVTPADAFVPAPVGNGRILIGKRTGFAVYRDQRRDRKILIGVFHDNVAANNYLDGPFDQMPDNFIEGDIPQCHSRGRTGSQGPDQSLRQFGRRRARCGRALYGIPQPEGPRGLRSLRDQPADPERSGTRPASRCRCAGDNGADARPMAMQRHAQ